MTQGAGWYYGIRFGQSSRLVQSGSSPPRGGQGTPKKRMSDGDHPGIGDVIMEEAGKVVKELSPNVTPYRKVREPKRARSVSYWDNDILGGANKENVRVEDAVNGKRPGGADEDREMLLEKNHE